MRNLQEFINFVTKKRKYHTSARRGGVRKRLKLSDACCGERTSVRKEESSKCSSNATLTPVAFMLLNRIHIVNRTAAKFYPQFL